MTKFKDRYRIETARLPGWDYAQAGWYFVTICTKNHVPLFGQVDGNDVILSPIGVIVAEEWRRTPHVRPNVTLDAWVIMPNHLHGIVVITDPTPVQIHKEGAGQRGITTGTESPADVTIPAASPARLQPGSLGAIIGQIKSVSTKRIRAAGYPHFAWQTRFHDHIIRDRDTLHTIRQYIANNAARWADDRYYRP